MHQFCNQDEESYIKGMRGIQNIDIKSSAVKGKLSMPGTLARGSESESEVVFSRNRGKTGPSSEAERPTTKLSEEDTTHAMGDDRSKLLHYAKACLPIAATICFS